MHIILQCGSNLRLRHHGEEVGGGDKGEVQLPIWLCGEVWEGGAGVTGRGAAHEQNLTVDISYLRNPVQ